MDNTIQLYIDKNQEIKGYPITSPDRVIDENGVNIKEQLDTIANLQSDDVKEFQFNATCSSGNWYRLFKIAETSISPLINFNFQLYYHFF